MFSRASNSGSKGDGTGLVYLAIISLLGVTLVSLNGRGAVSIERIIIGVSSIGHGSDVAITEVAALLTPPSLVPAHGRLQMLVSEELGGSVFTESNKTEPVSRMVLWSMVPHRTVLCTTTPVTGFSPQFSGYIYLAPQWPRNVRRQCCSNGSPLPKQHRRP